MVNKPYIDFSELDSWCFHVETTCKTIKRFVKGGSLSLDDAYTKLYDSVESEFLHIPECFIDCMREYEHDKWCNWIKALDDICSCSTWIRTYE